jgi:hypothetical protein
MDVGFHHSRVHAELGVILDPEINVGLNGRLVE